MVLGPPPSPALDQMGREVNTLQGTDISPSQYYSISDSHSSGAHPVNDTKASVGPGASPASEARELSLSLISRSFGQVLAFSFFLQIMHSSPLPADFFNRILDYF